MNYCDMEIIKAPVTKYSELGQTSKVKFSIAVVEGKKLKQLFSPVNCRDYLNEVVRKQHNPAFKDVIYGFNSHTVPVFDHDNPPILLCHNFPKKSHAVLKELLGNYEYSKTAEDNILMIPLLDKEYLNTYLMSYISHMVRVIELFPKEVFCLDKHTGYVNEISYAKQLKQACRCELQHLLEFYKDNKAKIIGTCGATGMDELPSMTGGQNYHGAAGMLGVMRCKTNKVRLLFEDWYVTNYGEDQ